MKVKNLKNYASDLGLDSVTFDACLDSGEKAGVVALNIAEGKDLGVTGTPTFFIGEEMLVGAGDLASFKEIIDPLLEA